MNRRQALQIMGVIGGGVIIGLDNFLLGCKSPENKSLNFSADIIALLDEIGETIIPTTDTPGAKAAQIGNFMKIIVTDCYTPEEQQIFMQGISDIDKVSKEKFSKKFIDLSAQERLDLLNELNTKYASNPMSKEDKTPPHYFVLLKQLTIWGYFTSEIGQTKAMRYTPVPGKYEPCIDYKKGDKAFC